MSQCLLYDSHGQRHIMSGCVQNTKNYLLNYIYIYIKLFLLMSVAVSNDICCYFLDDISLSCKNVTGTVGEDVTFTCSVSLTCSQSSITLYKFLYPERYNDPTICREEFPPGSCEQRNSFTCRFTPTTVMMEQFRFFIQAVCGWELTEFTVNISGTLYHNVISINVCNIFIRNVCEENLSDV